MKEELEIGNMEQLVAFINEMEGEFIIRLELEGEESERKGTF